MRTLAKNTEYILVTPARNEEAHIETTIGSVVSQTILPVKWFIVSDGSTDRTEEIVCRYLKLHDFIELLTTDGTRRRSFGSKVEAFRKGYEQIRNTAYDFVGNLDADVSFSNVYFEYVLNKFHDNPKLGIAGGIVMELIDDKFKVQNNSLNSVAGAIQLFRHKCYEDIGGYIAIKTGGVDSAAEIMARMNGWEVRTFPEVRVLHHRRVSAGNGRIITSRFRHGMTHYLLGYHLLFEVAKCIYRIKDRPYVLGSLATMLGYIWSLCRRYKRPVPDNMVEYLRREQKQRLRSLMQCDKDGEKESKLNSHQ